MSEPQPAGGMDGLVALIDRLETLLNESELSEIEIEAGETALVLRKPAALPAAGGLPPADGGAPTSAGAAPGPAAVDDAAGGSAPAVPAILAPLTGLFYSAPSPGAQPYVKVGGEVLVGQVIGLIEAMKLFNEIKSDQAGRVKRICAEDGALVKAKQPLIEIEP